MVSPENLAVTRTPKVSVNDKNFYAHRLAHHRRRRTAMSSGTMAARPASALISGCSSTAAWESVVLTNQQNVGFPDAVGQWTLDRLLDNPPVDYAAGKLKLLQANFKTVAETYAKPASPRPFPPLAALAGNFVNPSLGKLTLRADGDTFVLDFIATGAQLRLEPWDGDIFTARLVATGKFADVVKNIGDLPSGFAQFQMDAAGKLGSLRLSFDGQAYQLVRNQ